LSALHFILSGRQIYAAFFAAAHFIKRNARLQRAA